MLLVSKTKIICCNSTGRVINQNYIEVSEFANKLTFILRVGWFQTSFFCFDKILNTTAGPIIGVVIVVHVAKTIVAV